MKKFLVIGSMNAVTYREVYALIKDNAIMLGRNEVHEFVSVDGKLKGIVPTYWYTNMSDGSEREELELTCKYDAEKYKKYNNCDAINVDLVEEIPCDYVGVMGVPITFFYKYCPAQFEIVGNINKGDFWDGCTYKRLLIKRKK